MNKIEAILFDIDGTLLDTRELIIQALEYTIKKYKLASPSAKSVYEVMGKTLKDGYAYLYPFGDLVQLCETHSDFQASNLHLSVPFLNTLKTLEELKQKGIKMAIVTSRSNRTAEKILQLAGIANYFDLIITSDDVINPKPDPAGIFKALEILKVTPARAVMIGDTDADILAGKNAGIMTIGVSYGFHGKKISELNPDFIVDDIVEMLTILFFGIDSK